MCHAAQNLDPTFDNLTLKMTLFSQYATNIVAIALLSVKESITMITSTTQRGIKMTVDRKQQLITNWGFMPTLDGMYFRHAPMGYLEQWLASNPDVIQFIKDGEYSHDYKIDWTLFN